jgi:SNF2 family DNA or RNA helicase
MVNFSPEPRHFGNGYRKCALSLEKSGDGLRFHPFAARFSRNSARKWDNSRPINVGAIIYNAFRRVRILLPEVPSTLQAELCDYQLEGFRWLARLARWLAAVLPMIWD